MFGIRRGLLLIVLLFLATGGYKHFSYLTDLFHDSSATETENTVTEEDRGKQNTPRTVRLSEQRRVHILYGDNRGGGHLAGTGKACKSEFPDNWNAADVIDRVKQVAANDNLHWKRETNGYYTAEQTVEDVRIKVVLAGNKRDIVTAYPVNAERNHCPRNLPANDNYNR